MFDVTTEIEIPIRLAASSGELQEVKVRWPSDSEWATRQKARAIIRRDLGRGRWETQVPQPGEHDIALLSKITLNGSPQLSAAEASKILDTMALADVTGVTIEGVTAKIELRTMMGTVNHEVKIPTAEQIFAFRRAGLRVTQLPYNQHELRTTPEAGARLYDECGGKSSDYAGGVVPNLHKDAVMRELIDEMDRELGPRKDDANF